MALDTASEGNFNTRNPEEVVRLIENLASNNSTKNTDFQKRKSATQGKEELDDVKVSWIVFTSFSRSRLALHRM